jgi:hypothetical protein
MYTIFIGFQGVAFDLIPRYNRTRSACLVLDTGGNNISNNIKPVWQIVTEHFGSGYKTGNRLRINEPNRPPNEKGHPVVYGLDGGVLQIIQ